MKIIQTRFGLPDADDFDPVLLEQVARLIAEHAEAEARLWGWVTYPVEPRRGHKPPLNRGIVVVTA